MKFYADEIKSRGSVTQRGLLDPIKLIGQPQQFYEFNEPITVEAKASISTTDFLVSGNIATNATCICARCLEKFQQRIRSEFNTTYDLNLSEFDIESDIREAFIIEMPQVNLCSPTCKGLCAECGINLNLEQCKCDKSNASNRDKKSIWSALDRFST